MNVGGLSIIVLIVGHFLAVESLASSHDFRACLLTGVSSILQKFGNKSQKDPFKQILRHHDLLTLPGAPATGRSLEKTKVLGSEDFNVTERIKKSDFGTHRRLATGNENYLEALPIHFMETLPTLGSQDIWLDLGSGQAQAQREYLSSDIIQGLTLPPVYQRAKVIALSYDEPPPIPAMDYKIHQIEIQRKERIFGRNFGRFFQDIPDSELNLWKGKVRLATSLMGIPDYVHSNEYTYQFGRILSLLAPYGELDMTFHADGLVFYGPHGENIGFTGWEARMRAFFSSIKGVELVDLRFAQWSRITLRRTSGPIEVPELVPLEFKDGKPPIRNFYYPGFKDKSP